MSIPPMVTPSRAAPPVTEGTADGSASTRPALSFEARAYQSFVRGLRGFWRDEAYRGVVQAARERQGDTPAGLERALRDTPHYQLYAWLERHSQQFKYYGRYGVVALMQTQAEPLQALLQEASRRCPERLRLDPDFAVPEYVRAVDTHQHAGGLWSDAYDAFAYEAATDGYSFSLFNSRSPMTVYGEAAARLAARAVGDSMHPPRIIDVGCTIGNSTRALARALPRAQIHGLDVCGPVLALAHLRSVQQHLPITYWQRSAEALGFEGSSVDVVASHWLFHEMPVAAVRRALREAHRVLVPGGGFIAYDMYLCPGGPVGEWLHAGYAARNNEPFALGYARMDMRRELEEAGFDDVHIELAHPEPDAAVRAGDLPEARTHYITLITARRRG
jgi:ubiquinone/menaquinone biosynthesis C-methylase UbiE